MTKAIKKDVAGEQTSLTPIVPQTIENFNVENLIAQAINQKLPVETMERFFTLAKEMQAIRAKQLYNEAMAAFQSDCPTIQKTKEGGRTQNGQVAYHYAPLESIVAQVKDLLQKHGFSYSTSMEVLPDGVKVCVKTIHVAGHSEESCMQVPLGTQTKVMSASQQTAAATTFAKRYAFCNAFGILTGDEDNDGANIGTGQETLALGQIQASGDLRPAPTTPAKWHTPVGSGNMATDKQLSLMVDLLRRKNVKSIDLPVKFPWYVQGCISNKTVTKDQASEMLEWLFSYVPGHDVKDELPTIQQEPTPEEQQELDNLAAQVPF